MNRRFLTKLLSYSAICAVSLIFLALTGCKKADHMGKIHGMWQIMSIETPNPDDPNGPDVEVEMTQRRYISFQFDVVQLSSEDDTFITPGYSYVFVGKLDGEDPDYTMIFPYANTPAKLDMIKPWGIDTTPVKLHVEKLDSKELIMKIGDNTITARRF